MTSLEVLGLQPGASEADIRFAYKRLAAKHHPDKGGDAAEFQRIVTAYKVLTRSVCADCGGDGFIYVRNGSFTRKTECPTCWLTK